MYSAAIFTRHFAVLHARDEEVGGSASEPVRGTGRYMYRIVTAPVWTNSLKCPRTEEAFIGSRAQPETQ